MDPAESDFKTRVERMREKLSELAQKQPSTQEIALAALDLISDIDRERQQQTALRERLAFVGAESGELLAELELKREELDRLNNELDEANREKNYLLGVAAHDIRSGLSGIGGLAELLDDCVEPNNSEARNHADMIRAEGRRLLDLLDSLLDVSRIGLGRIDLDPQMVSLKNLVESSIEFHKYFVRKKGQTVSLTAGGTAAIVKADPLRIRQVIDNLISNAVKYSRLETEIAVTVGISGNEAVVAVADEGPGLTPEDFDRLFEPYQTLSARPTGKEDRHGLGLAIAKRSIDLHCGRIWAENRSDGRKGTVFNFALPLAKGAYGQIKNPKTTFDPVARSEHSKRSSSLQRILVAEDNPVLRLLVKRMLDLAGYAAVIVESGVRALELIGSQDFDCFLTDIRMPEMDGFETARAIRKKFPQKNLPIIGITADKVENILAESRAAGIGEVIRKPLSSQNLIDVIERHCGITCDR